jgi:WXXGXW repeat (2 copies)
MRTNHSLRFLLTVLAMFITSAAAFAQIGITVSFGPPALPVYEQPICPADGWMWTPGYWAWDPNYGDYYWVPGTWVEVPQVGYLWTPGYWGWGGGGFLWHEGYWGPHVGFYGGINYGFGFFGVGFEGGRWQGRQFYYNRNVTNVNATLIHNVYNTTVVNRTTVNRISYNGGEGGIPARPTPQEETWANERHIPPVAAQVQHIQTARTNPQLRASANNGKPPIAATARPGEFSGTGTVPAKREGTSAAAGRVDDGKRQLHAPIHFGGIEAPAQEEPRLQGEIPASDGAGLWRYRHLRPHAKKFPGVHL